MKKYEFEYRHHAELKEQIFIGVDSAGNIVSAQMKSRLLGKYIDVLKEVLESEYMRKEAMDDFHFACRNEVCELLHEQNNNHYPDEWELSHND